MKTLLPFALFLMIQLPVFSQQKLQVTIIDKDTFLLIKPSQAKECVDYKTKTKILYEIIQNTDKIIIPEYKKKIATKDSLISEAKNQSEINAKMYEKTLSLLNEEREYFLAETKKIRRQRNILAGFSLFLASLLIIK